MTYKREYFVVLGSGEFFVFRSEKRYRFSPFQTKRLAIRSKVLKMVFDLHARAGVFLEPGVAHAHPAYSTVKNFKLN